MIRRCSSASRTARWTASAIPFLQGKRYSIREASGVDDDEEWDKDRKTARHIVTVRNANPFPVRFEMEYPLDSDRIYSGFGGRVVEKPGKRVWTMTVPANKAVQLRFKSADRDD